MSGSINELLAQTLLFTASPKPRLVSTSFPVSRAPTGGATAAGAATRRIWEYELQGLDSLRNVGVRHNQDVTVTLPGPHSMRYTARIHAPVAGRWQIVMHHGAAYALSYSSAVDWAERGNDFLTTDLQGDDDENGQWALFYWHLRYKLLQHALREVDPTDTLADLLGSSDKYAERLSWDTAGFQAARNL